MFQLTNSSLENYANTLLHLCDSVTVVDSEFRINYYLKKQADGTVLSTVGGLLDNFNLEPAITAELKSIKAAISAAQPFQKVFRIVNGSTSTKYKLDVLKIPELPDNSFITNIKIREDSHLSRDGWKQALETIGDGIWELNLATGEIKFSEKWRQIFGAVDTNIKTLNDWLEIIHPDDRIAIGDTFSKYASGSIPSYATEIRYKNNNGEYKWLLSRGVIVERKPTGEPLLFVGTHTDIHNTKIKDQQHRINLGTLLRLVNSLPSGMLVTDENKKIIFTNKAFCALYGLDKHPRELQGQDADLMLQSDKKLYKNEEQLLERIASLLQNREPIFGEELEMADGRIISRDFIPIQFGDNFKGEIWRFTDITEKKTIERKFKEQRGFYEHILNSLPANIAVFNEKTEALYVNPKGIKDDFIRNWVIGKTLEEFCEKSLIPKEIYEDRIGFFHTAVREKRQVGWDEEILSKSGKTYYQYRCFSPVLKENGELDIMIAYGIDISDRVKAEKALNTSLTALANTFNHSGIAKALITPDGYWLEVNHRMSELTGYSKDELYKLSYESITYPEDIGTELPFVTKLLAREIPAFTIEKRFISKTRQVVTTSLTVSMVWENEKTPRYFICDIVDITMQKQLLEEVNRKNAELEATGQSLSNKIKQLEELNHIIAHNLRGPANNISMLSERLVMGDNDPAAEDEPFTKQEAGEIIHESSIKLTNSLNTLMELMQIRLNSDIPLSECVFDPMVKDISTQLYSVIYEKQAVINCDFAVASINYPKVYLESILYNLMSNALKYNKPGLAPVINISTVEKDNKVQLIVSDNGLGIDLERYGSKIFKLNQVFHRGYDSKGVGLYLTKNQIESLGGSIEIKSKVNEGCEFTVTF